MYSLRMEHKVFGYLLIEASGIQVHRFINICHFREIALNNLKMNGDTAEFVIAESDRQEIIDIGSKYGVSICVKKARGIPFYIRYYGKRWGFVIGAVLCYAFYVRMCMGNGDGRKFLL